MAKITEDNIPQAELLSVSNGMAEIVTAVSRKVNIGNYENIDVGLTVRIPFDPELSKEELEQYLEGLEEKTAVVAQKGFSIASSETYDRYKSIKDQI